jgi:hypothetical protein
MDLVTYIASTSFFWCFAFYFIPVAGGKIDPENPFQAEGMKVSRNQRRCVADTWLLLERVLGSAML